MNLKIIAQHPLFLSMVATAYHRITVHGHATHDAMEELTVAAAEMFHLHTDFDEDVAQFWHSSSRAAKPACILVSPNEAQDLSPSAVLSYRSERYIVQVFNQGADDAGLAAVREDAGCWFETENRVLLG